MNPGRIDRRIQAKEGDNNMLTRRQWKWAGYTVDRIQDITRWALLRLRKTKHKIYIVPKATFSFILCIVACNGLYRNGVPIVPICNA